MPEPPVIWFTCPRCKRKVRADQVEQVWYEHLCPTCAETARDSIAAVIGKLVDRQPKDKDDAD